jgi:OOP family OmpA-OmpF porin
MSAVKRQGVRKAGDMAMLCLAALCLPSAVSALDLAFPGTAELVQSSAPTQAQHPIATGAYNGGAVPLISADGMVQTTVWHVTGEDVSTASIHQAVADQLSAQGYEVTYSCAAASCGGFDFRHALPVGQAPEMFVDLGNFQYVAAQIERDTGTEQIALMISEGGATGFVHVARILPAEAVVSTPVVQSSRSPDTEVDLAPAQQFGADTVIEILTRMGSAPLDDLRFETGASQLSGESYPSLTALAAFLEANPAQAVVLVGHTDASGSLDGNIALSEARAIAVRRFLTGELGVRPSQVEAQGIGFLSPRASNANAEGREANRRVEVVLANPG